MEVSTDAHTKRGVRRNDFWGNNSEDDVDDAQCTLSLPRYLVFANQIDYTEKLAHYMNWIFGFYYIGSNRHNWATKTW